MERPEGSRAPTGSYGPGGGLCSQSLGPFSGEPRESFPTPRGGREGRGETPRSLQPPLSRSPPHRPGRAVPRTRRPGGRVPFLGRRGEGAGGFPHEPPVGLEAAPVPGLPVRRPARRQRLGPAYEAARPRGEDWGAGLGSRVLEVEEAGLGSPVLGVGEEGLGSPVLGVEEEGLGSRSWGWRKRG